MRASPLTLAAWLACTAACTRRPAQPSTPPPSTPQPAAPDTGALDRNANNSSETSVAAAADVVAPARETACVAFRRCCTELRSTPGTEPIRPACASLEQLASLGAGAERACGSALDALKVSAGSMAIPASCSAPTPASSSAPSATGKPDEGLCAPLARCCVAIRGREDPPLRPIQTQCELLNASDPSAMLDDASCVIAVRAIREVLHASPAIPAVCTPVVARDQTGSVP